MAERLVTERLVLRSWNVDDAVAALGAYGEAEVARRLAPAMDRVHDLAAMRLVLQQWIAEDARMMTPAGRWAIELRQDGHVIGGATLLPLQPDEEFEVGWQLHPGAWGHGYATESGLSLARWAFSQDIRPGHRARPASQHARGGDGAAYRHGMGRRDREIPWPAPAGIPPPSRRSRRDRKQVTGAVTITRSASLIF